MTLPRPLPALTADSRPFWTGGACGELLIEQCCACEYLIHPPTGFCPVCEGRETRFAPVSGKAFVETFTINHKQWMPGLPERYVLALVRLAEQDDVRLATNIVGCAPEDVSFGMPVSVRFEQCEDIWVPLFAPDAGA
ncbi:Zn-ribbon domain-containing OB-fold protein [Novosphingobium tardum]|uniref:Zn-ribbon domain-containing OB-fold protein n=1 Tax=Novosphingobium tardum TaxID=1538021 RepID=A0ABV8RS89_9SPHN